jgi:hypothetical protein
MALAHQVALLFASFFGIANATGIVQLPHASAMLFYLFLSARKPLELVCFLVLRVQLGNIRDMA